LDSSSTIGPGTATSTTEFISTLVFDGEALGTCRVELENPPIEASALLDLPQTGMKSFLNSLKRGEIEQICLILNQDDYQLSTTSTMDESVLGKKQQHFESQTWESLKTNPLYQDLQEYSDIFLDQPPSELPKDRGFRHEIELTPGTGYCFTRQWPLPRNQVEAIDEFFDRKYRAGQVRPSQSPHSSPTFCVKKSTGGWRIVHAFNKLNDATVPAQIPMPRKDTILYGMAGSTIFSTIDLLDGFYQVLMREKDIPLTAVSTPSGMLWEWLVMPQGLRNAPATFNRMVQTIMRPLRQFAPGYFDDIFIHSRAQDGRTDLEVHREHIRAVFQTMREHKLYANLKKCHFAQPEIPVLGCVVSKQGVRPDPEKVIAISDWPPPTCIKDLRKWLGLANYLHKYTRNYAAIVRPLTQLLRKDVEWQWTKEHQDSFDQVKLSLREAPILMLPDYSKPFHVVCDASQFAIGCALMQHDDEGRERVVAYESRQLQAAELNYPVHDKELLAMKYALAKFRVHLMGEAKFAIYTDHASLRTAVKSPHLSQRMARWLSFFAEYNFVVYYKPGPTNILADALSRRPDFDPSALQSSDDSCVACLHSSSDLHSVTRVQSTLRDDIITAYAVDPDCAALMEHLSLQQDSSKLPSHLQSRVDRYSFHDGLLYYSIDQHDAPRIVVPNDEDLRLRLISEFHDTPVGGHLGREKTFLSLSRDYYWPHQYKWVRKYIRTCEICQRVKPSASSQAPLKPLPIPSDCWRSVSLDFVFGLPKDGKNRTGILVFVDRFSKMVHLAAVSANVTAKETAQIFLDLVFKHHGLPSELVSDRDPRFTSHFWRAVFDKLGTKLAMSTAAHPETDGQTERVNRVLGDILRSYATSFKHWSEFLPLVEFALNNSVHASTGFTPFFLNNGRHPTLPTSILSGGEATNDVAEQLHVTNDTAINANFSPLEPLEMATTANKKSVSDFLDQREAILRYVRDAIALSVDKQKENADKIGRKNKNVFKINDMVLLSTTNLPKHAITHVGSNKLLPRFIGPFRIVSRKGDAYTLDIPTGMRLHPTFYVGRLKRYHSWTTESEVSLDDPSSTPPLEQSRRQLSHRGPASASPACDVPASAPASAPPRDYASQSRDSLSVPAGTMFPTLESSSVATSEGHPCLRGEVRPSSPTSRNVQSRPSVTLRKHQQYSRESSQTSRGVQPPSQSPPQCDGPSHQDRSPAARNVSSPPRLRNRSRRVRFARPPPPPLVDSDGDARYIVESILAHENRIVKSRRTDIQEVYYLVRWRGYSSDHDTWEPHSKLSQDVPDVLRDYYCRSSAPN